LKTLENSLEKPLGNSLEKWHPALLFMYQSKKEHEASMQLDYERHDA